MPKFRKKPVVIEAWQFDGSSASAQPLLSFSGAITFHGDGYLTIKTLEGEMRADAGDWIIHGVQGEFYPCKPDIFEKTYEPVE